MKRYIAIMAVASNITCAMEQECLWVLEQPLMQEMETENLWERYYQKPIHETVTLKLEGESYPEVKYSLNTAKDLLFWAQHFALLPKDVQRIILSYLEWNGYCKTFGCFIGKDSKNEEAEQEITIQNWELPELIEIGQDADSCCCSLYQLFCCCICYGLPHQNNIYHTNPYYYCGPCGSTGSPDPILRYGYCGMKMEKKHSIILNKHSFKWTENPSSFSLSDPNKPGIYAVGPHISSIQDSTNPKVTHLKESDAQWHNAVHSDEPLVALWNQGTLKLCTVTLTQENAIQSIQEHEFKNLYVNQVAFLSGSRVAILDEYGMVMIYEQKNNQLTKRHTIDVKKELSSLFDFSINSPFTLELKSKKAHPYLILKITHDNKEESVALNPKTLQYVALYKNECCWSDGSALQKPTTTVCFSEDETPYLSSQLLAAAAYHWINKRDSRKKTIAKKVALAEKIINFFYRMPLQDRMRLVWRTTNSNNLFKEIKEMLPPENKKENE